MFNQKVRINSKKVNFILSFYKILLKKSRILYSKGKLGQDVNSAADNRAKQKAKNSAA